MSVHQLDAGHLCAITLAVAGLQDARVSTGARSELRADFVEQLVVQPPNLYVTSSEATVVQRAGACFRNQSLDEWAQLFCARLCRLDRTALDQSHRKPSQEGELLLGGAF